MLEAIVALILLVPLLFCVADDDDPSPLWALLWLVVFSYIGLAITGGLFGGVVMAGSWIVANLVTVLWGALVYLIGAAVYATVEWVLFNRTHIKTFNANDAKWRVEYANLKNKDSYASYSAYVESAYDFPPRISRYRYKFITWMMWWPICFIARIFNLRKLAIWAFDWMTNFWTNLQRKMWEKTGIYTTTEKTNAPST